MLPSDSDTSPQLFQGGLPDQGNAVQTNGGAVPEGGLQCGDVPLSDGNMESKASGLNYAARA